MCNYGPPGNYNGEKPYVIGKKCAACPGSCENGLCVNTPKKICQDNWISLTWNNVKYTSCNDIISKVGKKICTQWPEVGSDYCWRSCGNCQDDPDIGTCPTGEKYTLLYHK